MGRDLRSPVHVEQFDRFQEVAATRADFIQYVPMSNLFGHDNSQVSLDRGVLGRRTIGPSIGRLAEEDAAVDHPHPYGFPDLVMVENPVRHRAETAGPHPVREQFAGPVLIE